MRVIHLMALAVALLLEPLPALAEPPARIRPVLLVPGLWYKYAPLVLQKSVFGRYTEWLVEEGYVRQDIHVLDYPTALSLRAVTRRLVDQMNALERAYPPGTKFDMITHSLGAFVGLYAAAESGFIDKIQKFISLAGVPQGWDGPTVCRYGLCGLIHPKIIPFRSDFIVDYLDRYQDAIDALDKCSLFSPRDELVRPYDAGAFKDGINIELTDVKHMDMVWSYDSFRAMRASCYPSEEH